MRMSDAEAIMWAVEKDPALRSDFTNISILERAPDAARVRAKVEQAIEAIPRLGDRVVAPPFRLATPEWVPDHDLDLDYHLRTIAVPSPGGMRQLLDLAAAVAATPLDRSRPLWEFTVVEGLERGRAAFLQKVHHTITDGVGAVKLSLSLLDFEPDPPAPPEPSPTQRIAAEAEAERRAEAFADPVKRVSPANAVEKAVVYTVRQQLGRTRRGLESAARVLASPESARRGVDDVVRLAGSVRRQLMVTDPARSQLLARRSLALRFKRVHERLHGLRDEPAVTAAGSLAGLLAALPTSMLVSLTRTQAHTIDFATSNLRGSPVDLYLGGARIEGNYPMGPRAACALNVTLLSYRDSLDMGINIDPAAVSDPATLIDCLEESFGALLDVD